MPLPRPAVELLATSPEGDCWRFTSGCLPDEEGWVSDCPLSFATLDDPSCD